MSRGRSEPREPQAELSEYERFEAFTRRLVQVPKKEIDRKRAQEQAKKSAR